jgi:hypothetical protein
MRNILTVLLFCIYPSVINAQVIRINNGVSITSLKDSKVNILPNHIMPYHLSLGIDYVKNKRWNLSSEISYINIGGLEKDILIDNTLSTIKEKSKYIQLNTTFRIKTSKKYQSAYIGIGPSVGFLTGNGKFKSIYLSDYNINRFLYGVKSEAGINAHLGKNLYAGINISYFYYLKEFAISDFDKLNCNLFALTLMIGYEF